MKTTAIIGVGSPFGEDDVAFKVIEKLKPRAQDIHCQYYDRPGLHLLETINTFDVVHLIDAVMSGNTLGTLYQFNDLDQFKKNTKPLSTHAFGLAETLALGNTLDLLPKKLVIHGIEISKNREVDCNIETILNNATEMLTNKLVSALE